MDDLSYAYSGNQLISVSDAVPDNANIAGYDFADNGSELTRGEYLYDANGNLIEDKNIGITVKYNHLDRTQCYTCYHWLPGIMKKYGAVAE